ncbi:hypothetical protein BYT27DRAFT_7248265 [Phlegmacium glaucopus]|nr:hypothetical protein BYT27DRAFT_7248265 [Phlegmacium glaucopus]
MPDSRNPNICHCVIDIAVVLIILCIFVPHLWIGAVVIVVLVVLSIALCIWRSSRTTTTVVQQPPSPNTRHSNSQVAGPPFLSITPLTEPQPIHSPISEHEQPHFILDFERIHQVQVMMVDIHRLENEPGGAVNHRQRIQELQRRVMELSNTTPATATDIEVGQYQVGSNIPPIPTNLPGLASVQTSEPPPAYIR